MTWRALAAALMALLCGTTSAAEFYQGKQVTIVVGFSSGGTYDATARLFARHLGKYLPGKPTVIVRNMPGAGSLIAAKSLHSSLPKDGTTIGVVGGGVVLEPLLGNPQATYDPRRFNWIRGRTRDNFLCLVWHTVPVQTLQDVIKRETVVGATGPGSRTLTYPKVLNELLGTKFKIVMGYPGGNEITLALERGEVEGYCGWALGSIKTRAPEWIRDGSQAARAVHAGESRFAERAARDRSRRHRERTPGHRVLGGRFRIGLAAGGASGYPGGAPYRAPDRIQCDDAGPVASRRSGRPRPRCRPGERG